MEARGAQPPLAPPWLRPCIGLQDLRDRTVLHGLRAAPWALLLKDIGSGINNV